MLRSGFGSETEECMTASGMEFAGEKWELGIELPRRAQGTKFPSGRGQRK